MRMELGASCFSFVKKTWYARISSGPNPSGDCWKWRANRETCWTYAVWVCGEKFRTCMSSSMRRQREVMAHSWATGLADSRRAQESVWEMRAERSESQGRPGCTRDGQTVDLSPPAKRVSPRLFIAIT